MVRKLLDNATAKEGYHRWGVKEIIWNMQHLQYVRDYFEDYKIVFVIRNFVDYFKSLVGSTWVKNEFGRYNYIAEWIEQTTYIMFTALREGQERVFRYEDMLADTLGLSQFCEVGHILPVEYIGSSSKPITQNDWNIIETHLPMINFLHEKCGYPQISRESFSDFKIIPAPPTAVRVSTAVINKPKPPLVPAGVSIRKNGGLLRPRRP